MNDDESTRPAPGKDSSSALERALRAPGSAAELSQEQRYLAMFRTAGPAAEGAAPGADESDRVVATVTPLRRGWRGAAARRVGAGTALAVGVAVAGAGVAAAYTGHLPAPVQNAVHSALGPIAPPPARTEPTSPERRASPTAPATPSPTSTPPPATSTPPAPPPPSPSTSHPSDPGHSQPSKSPTGPGPSQSPSKRPTAPTAPTAPTSPIPQPTSPPATPTASPSPTSTPSPPAPVAASASISGSTHRVPAGQSITLSGVVSTDDGSAVPDTRMALQRRGPHGWHRISWVVTDSAGAVSVTTPPADVTTGYRFHIRHHVTSAPWRVIVQPTLSTRATNDGTTVTVAVSSQGATPGDEVDLVSRGRHGPVVVGRATLDASGAATFQVTVTRRHPQVMVVLEATRLHGRASDIVQVPAASGGAEGRSQPRPDR